MTHFSRKRLFGGVASLAAAYALVLNVILSSLLLASITPADAAAGYAICHNDPGIAATQDNAGKTTGQPGAHCPLCTGSHAPGSPPVQTAFITTRIAVAIAPFAAHDDSVVAHVITSDHRARAPPQLS